MKSSDPYKRSNANEDITCNKLISTNRIYIVIIIGLASLLTRFYDIHEPAHVCWDETHFGKMASWYINRTFFFDVHPPLGKMLIALSGSLTGYDGTFPFEKPGDNYEHWTQYIGMRIFCATLGFLIPLFIYSATLSLTKSSHSAILSAILVLFDNGLITLTRYILLDSPLLFFIASAILGMSKLTSELNHRSEPEKQFNIISWFWLSWTGVAIACAFSVKFVGLFIVALIGLNTIYDLWQILGDTSRPIGYFCKHFVARAICLILLPICLYTSIFFIHLKQLNHSGSGDGFYSSAFQSQLIGNSLHNSSWPEHLAYNSEITVKNNRIGGAYLHSHWHLYPEGVGARQQQVTTYSHKDSNNKWLIKRALLARDLNKNDNANESNDIFVRDGDLIILEHVNTKRNLHSHFEQAPVTKRHYQVTCYGENGLGDANDVWQIKKDQTSGLSTSNDDRIYTVKSRFMLIHYLTNCALHSHSRQLPKWAYEQLEVTCNPKLHHKNNYWNIEDNYNPSLPNVSFEAYSPSFYEQFLESHAVMLQGNSGLKPKEGEVTSRPWQWPIIYKGQFFSASKGQKVYLLGNPIVWWLNLVCIPLSSMIICIIVIANKISGHKTIVGSSVGVLSDKVSRNHQKKQQQERSRSVDADIDQTSAVIIQSKTYIFASFWILLGWAIHYVPFYFMGRVLYFHHYFPAFLFSCMLTGVTLDYLISSILVRMRRRRSSGFNKWISSRKRDFTLLLLSIVVYTYLKFIPITYGTRPFELTTTASSILSTSSNYTSNDGNSTHDNDDKLADWRSEQKLASLKWLDSWEF